MAISRVWNLQGIDRLAFLIRDLCHRDDTFHRAYVGQLRGPQHDVADRINAWLFRFQPFVYLDEAAIGTNLRLLQPHVLTAWLAADCDQDLLRLHLLLLAVGAERHRYTRFRLFNF